MMKIFLQKPVVPPSVITFALGGMLLAGCVGNPMTVSSGSNALMASTSGAKLVASIQFAPSDSQSNPPVIAEPQWDTPRTRELFFRACADCHSNETTWPWYSGIPLLSALIEHDVKEGRSEFNISEWGVAENNEGDEAAETVRDGSMPPSYYTIAHPSAQLSSEEKQELIAGLVATFGDEGEEGDEEEEDEENEKDEAANKAGDGKEGKENEGKGEENVKDKDREREEDEEKNKAGDSKKDKGNEGKGEGNLKNKDREQEGDKEKNQAEDGKEDKGDEGKGEGDVEGEEDGEDDEEEGDDD